MDYTGSRTVVKDVMHVVVLVLLVVALWFVLVWSGIIQCDLIPGGCEAYWGVMRATSGGKPYVLIVYGESGMGNPGLLEDVLRNPTYAGARVRSMPLEQASIGNLREYDLVIVEKARRMSTERLRAFVDYAIQGGRLVWTGDAGTELAGSDVELYEHERQGKQTCDDVMQQSPHARIEEIDCSFPGNEPKCEEYKSDPGILIAGVDCVWKANANALNPWARKDGFGRMINFDQLIGAEYYGQFCERMGCMPEDYPSIGALVPEPERKHPLIRNMGGRADHGLVLRGDFALVKESGEAYTTRVLSVEFPGVIEGYDVGDDKLLPVIVTQGMGQRVAYYAVPPEQFVASELPEEQRYYMLVENMYAGMLGFSG